MMTSNTIIQNNTMVDARVKTFLSQLSVQQEEDRSHQWKMTPFYQQTAFHAILITTCWGKVNVGLIFMQQSNTANILLYSIPMRQYNIREAPSYMFLWPTSPPYFNQGCDWHLCWSSVFYTHEPTPWYTYGENMSMPLPLFITSKQGCAFVLTWASYQQTQWIVHWQPTETLLLVQSTTHKDDLLKSEDSREL